ncbi:MAG: DNA internalization-related competence protein ComEC/Rec2 [Bacilli bacterium]|nr:DNA internalization-related competence protein ComEC/Rec2 [Bacilli bacterium]MDD4053563.1 DNA internalization-related competence protein ComEC/Rec2 [Bacilli bacterium]MDD4411470.1 DNA internalization-related competence protein ComEC/Rec2 [Bacilli bacterium]
MIRLRTLLLCDKLYLILCAIAVVFSLLMLNYYPYHSKYNVTDKYVIGYIHSYKIDGNKLTIMLKGKESVIINYYFKNLAEKESFNFNLGDYLKVSGEMKNPKSATVLNLFDYKEYLYRNQIFFLLDAQSLELVGNNNRIRYTIKQFVINHINSLPKSSTYVKALVIGDDGEFNEVVNNSYQFNGVSHLFAISGSHIAFLAVIILWILKKLKFEENKRYYIVIVFLVFYMFLTDYTGSVVRAVFFFSLLSINKMYYFNIKTVNILQLTLFGSLIYKPALIYDVGFQFSYVISLYLILYQKMISSSRSYIKQTFLVSFIAFLASIPICANNFFQINLLSPFINVFFVPYVTFIMFPLSFICLILPFLDSVLFFFSNILETISIFLSTIKTGEIILAKPSFIIIVLYYIAITLCLRGMSKSSYKYFLLLSLLIIIHSNINYFNNNPYVVFLDVGQGDSTFINLPHNQGNILIDTGGKMDYVKESWEERKHKYIIGEDTIIPYLKSIGIKSLDSLILTHGDNDHSGDALYLVENFKVDNVILNIGEYNDLELELIKVLKEKNIPYYQNIETLNIGDDKLYFLNTKDYNDENENSSVIYTEIDNTKMLFMGDAGTEREKDILEKYNFTDIDILKVGHHGSNTSSSKYFINSINTKTCLISVGANNRYGHPKESVLEILDDCNTYRTDLNGSIEIKLENNDYEIKTINP